MASRNPYSGIHPRSSSSLFDKYPGPADARSQPGGSHSLVKSGYGYGARAAGSPYMNGGAQSGSGGFRPATPNSKGQYSHSVLESLESQNENENTSVLSSKVSQLKQLTIAIGDEIRDSSALADQMNDSFDNTRVKLRGTMRRMLRMAERTGVGWKVWLGFFVAVWCLFAWVWLF
ncbi:hypothetical protein GJ744_002446 [Endocarpon pusillum]|uniref:t-SNARE coiled-coil homology domain-containing protein n=1 Tax=Endocarpon pusillum TaxID=364733 RepID=A0A8H7E2P2_9EURO|nr:hypothetical protein GJ744_002446 [Endocarpon pusillum]